MGNMGEEGNISSWPHSPRGSIHLTELGKGSVRYHKTHCSNQDALDSFPRNLLVIPRNFHLDNFCSALQVLFICIHSSRDHFKKIRDTKGTFYARMGSIKDRNCKELTEAEDIKKRRQEYTELYKKDLYIPYNCNAVITHLEPGILECEVKWALESIAMNKASESDRIPLELFQILRDHAVKVLHSICQQIWKTQ